MSAEAMGGGAAHGAMRRLPERWFQVSLHDAMLHYQPPAWASQRSAPAPLAQRSCSHMVHPASAMCSRPRSACACSPMTWSNVKRVELPSSPAKVTWRGSGSAAVRQRRPLSLELVGLMRRHTAVDVRLGCAASGCAMSCCCCVAARAVGFLVQVSRLADEGLVSAPTAA
jgi:hypothetical protein